MDSDKVIGKRKIIPTALRMAAYLLAVMLVFSAISVLYGNDGTYNQGEYGTLRMVLKLPPGEVYAISGKNVSYAQRLFMDGKEYPSIGVPGESIEVVTPKTTRYMEGFGPTGDTTEIIIHYSAFVYADGGGRYPLDIGLVRNVVRNEQLMVFYITEKTQNLLGAPCRRLSWKNTSRFIRGFQEAGIIREPLRAIVRKGKEHFVCDIRLELRLEAVRDKTKNGLQKEALLSLRTHYDMDDVAGLSGFDRRQVCVPKFCPKGCPGSSIL